MKFTAKKAVILHALQNVQSSVDKDNTSLLSNVKIEVKHGKVSLTTINMETESVDLFECNIEKDGVIAVSHSILTNVVRSIGTSMDEEVEFEYEKQEGSGLESASLKPIGRFVVKQGKSSFSLTAIGPESFPTISEEKDAVTFNIASTALLGVIQKTKNAICTEEHRFNLNALLLHSAEKDGVNVLRGVATDGHRLALAETTLADTNVKLRQILVPRKSVGELVKLLGNNVSENVIISVTDKRFSCQIGDMKFITKLVDGEFPDYNKAIPSANNLSLKIKVEHLLSGINRVSAVLSPTASKGVKFVIHNNVLHLSAKSDIVSDSANDEIPVNFEFGEKLETAYNSQYLKDILSSVDSDEAEILLTPGVVPALVKDPANANYYYVIMPMRM